MLYATSRCWRYWSCWCRCWCR